MGHLAALPVGLLYLVWRERYWRTRRLVPFHRWAGEPLREHALALLRQLPHETDADFPLIKAHATGPPSVTEGREGRRSIPLLIRRLSAIGRVQNMQDTLPLLQLQNACGCTLAVDEVHLGPDTPPTEPKSGGAEARLPLQLSSTDRRLEADMSRRCKGFLWGASWLDHISSMDALRRQAVDLTTVCVLCVVRSAASAAPSRGRSQKDALYIGPLL